MEWREDASKTLVELMGNQRRILVRVRRLFYDFWEICEEQGGPTFPVDQRGSIAH